MCWPGVLANHQGPKLLAHMLAFGTLPLHQDPSTFTVLQLGSRAHHASMLAEGSLLASFHPPGIKHMRKSPGLLHQPGHEPQVPSCPCQSHPPSCLQAYTCRPPQACPCWQSQALAPLEEILLVYSLNANSSWPRLKLGAQISIQFSRVGDKGPSSLAFFNCFPRCIVWEKGNRAAGTPTTILGCGHCKQQVNLFAVMPAPPVRI